ncbi:hypothetical protein [Bifidobacterium actinocoloniiforme]|nr:hypothetical protein [Bifidobacterium actinocoloniiforme]
MAYDDPQDVSMRRHGYDSVDQATARHLQVKTLLERRKDQIIDRLQDPRLTPGERERLQAAKEEVKRDIASIRVWGSEEDFDRMRRKYGRRG